MIQARAGHRPKTATKNRKIPKGGSGTAKPASGDASGWHSQAMDLLTRSGNEWASCIGAATNLIAERDELKRRLADTARTCMQLAVVTGYPNTEKAMRELLEELED
jgi:hypothetical protein